MIDQLLILAEAGHEASEGISPAFIGGGALLTLLVLLGLTFLTRGQHQGREDDEFGPHEH